MPIPDDWKRPDGSTKGLGFLGLLQLPNGKVASEYSIADSEKLKDKNGNYLDYPSLVPTLTKQEVQAVLNAATNNIDVPDSIKQKAEAFAIQRQQAGKPLFAQTGEQQNLYPDLKRAPIPSFYMPQRMSADDFANKLKEKFPDLKTFSSTAIVNKVLAVRPDLVDKIENPMAGDAAASAEQDRLRNQAQTQSAFTRSVLDAFPGIGGVIGSMFGSPILGGALGVGAGRGAEDLALQGLGLDNSTPTQKAGNIAKDVLTAGATSGVADAAMSPIRSLRTTLGDISNLEDAILPTRLRGFLKSPITDALANAIKEKPDPYTRPLDRSLIPTLDAEPTTDIPNTSSVKEGELVPPKQIGAGQVRFSVDPTGKTVDTLSNADDLKELNNVINKIITGQKPVTRLKWKITK